MVPTSRIRLLIGIFKDNHSWTWHDHLLFDNTLCQTGSLAPLPSNLCRQGLDEDCYLCRCRDHGLFLSRLYSRPPCILHSQITRKLAVTDVRHKVSSCKRVCHCPGGLQFGFGSLHLHFAAPSAVQTTDASQAEVGNHGHLSDRFDVSCFCPCTTLSHVHIVFHPLKKVVANSSRSAIVASSFGLYFRVPEANGQDLTWNALPAAALS